MPVLLATAALTVMSVGVATPAQADLLDPVGSVVEGILGEPVPTGWLYDSSATTMAEVRAAIGAPAVGAEIDRPERGIALIDRRWLVRHLPGPLRLHSGSTDRK